MAGPDEYKGVLRCPICMDCQEDSRWVALPCGHTLHDLCWMQAREHKSACPKCKTAVSKRHDGLRLYIDNEVEAGLTAAMTSDDAYQNIRRQYEQKIKLKENALDAASEKLRSLAHKVAELEEKASEQEALLANCKSRLRSCKADAKLAESQIKHEQTCRAEELKKHTEELRASLQDNARLQSEWSLMRKELDRLENKVAHLERNARGYKLTSDHHLSEAEVRKLCGVSTNQVIDVDVVICALLERNKLYQEVQSQLEGQKKEQEEVQLRHEQQLANLKREARDKIRQREQERDAARSQLNDLEYELGDLKAQVFMQQEQAGIDLDDYQQLSQPDDPHEQLQQQQQQQLQQQQRSQPFIAPASGLHRPPAPSTKPQHLKAQQQGSKPAGQAAAAHHSHDASRLSGDVWGDTVHPGAAGQPSLQQPAVVLDAGGDEAVLDQGSSGGASDISVAGTHTHQPAVALGTHLHGLRPSSDGGGVRRHGSSLPGLTGPSTAGRHLAGHHDGNKRPLKQDASSHPWSHKRPAVLARPAGAVADADTESFIGKAKARVRHVAGNPLKSIQLNTMQRPSFCSLDHKAVSGASRNNGVTQARPAAGVGKPGTKMQAKISQFIQQG